MVTAFSASSYVVAQIGWVAEKVLRRHSDPALRERNPSWFECRKKEEFLTRASGFGMTTLF
jgi:hypothetical protein